MYVNTYYVMYLFSMYALCHETQQVNILTTQSVSHLFRIHARVKGSLHVAAIEVVVSICALQTVLPLVKVFSAIASLDLLQPANDGSACGRETTAI
jgi:hypothetical protein